LGDKSAAYGGNLTFYLRQNRTDSQRNQDDILFAGGGYTLVYNTTYNPGSSWTYYSIPLIETTSGWKDKATGLAPTQAVMQAVLTNLQSLKIRAEYRYGDDIDWIDSVYLNSASFTPTPTLPPTFSPTATATFTPMP
jgi:alkaline phosphatase D